MEKKSKRELLSVISDQEEKVRRYETRFTDVVKAYKSLTKEKDALESTVKALAAQSPRRSEKRSPSSDPLGAGTPDSLDSVSDATRTDNSNDGSTVSFEDANFLQSKIETLSKALATVSEEKSKMEAAYQADKKKTLQRHGADIDGYCQTVDTLKETVDSLESKLLQCKNKVCQEQSERQKEQEDHAIMMKEFQVLLSKERSERDAMEKQLKEQLQSRQAVDSSNETTVKALEEQLRLALEEVHKTKEEGSRPGGDALKMMEDMYRERQQHDMELTAEKRRAVEAEESLRLLSLNAEKRITEMETQISEMASLIGKYEHTHIEDQKKVNKLKGQVSLMGDDNQMLANQMSSFETPLHKDADKIQELQQENFKLKVLLRVRLSKGDGDVDSGGESLQVNSELDDLLQSGGDTHHPCLIAYRQLKEEYSNYRKKIAASTSDTVSSSNSVPKDLVFLRQRSETLEHELSAVRDYYDNKEQELSLLVTKLQCDITRLEDGHRNDLKAVEETWQEKLVMLNDELKKQRRRAMDLLAEKDTEISRLMSIHDGRGRQDECHFETKQESVHAHSSVDNLRIEDTDNSPINSLLASKAANGGNGLVHYSHQLDRLGCDLASVRFENEDMKLVVRDAELREEKALQQMGFLKEEIRKLERDRSRETANLEYLKNIVLQYLLTDTFSVRQQMTNAMGTILQFSPLELKQVHKKMAGWWLTSR